MAWLLVLVFFMAIVLWVISTYNFFATSKARIQAAIEEIGNQLKRQAELIPNLESAAKGYLKHEKDIFEKLTEARQLIKKASEGGDLAKMDEASRKFSELLPSIQVLVEDNPELRSSEVIQSLMNELRDTSDKVMYARRLLIDLVADYNVRRVSFPSSLVANLFSFGPMRGIKTPIEGEHLETKEEELKTPEVKL